MLLSMPTYTKRAVHGASVVLFMSLLASVFAYLTKAVLARELGAADYGLFSAVFTFVIFFLFFRDLGFPQAIIKYTAQFMATKEYGKIKSVLSTAFSMQMAGSIIFAAAFYFLSDFLALHYFKDPQASLFLKLFIVYIFGSIFFIISKDALLGLHKTFLFSLGELLKNGLVFLLILLFLWQGQGVLAPVYAYALVCWILFFFFFPFLLHHFHFYNYTCEDIPAVRKQVVWFALPVFATAVGGKVIGYIDTLILTYFRPLSEVGIYNAVLPSALLFLYAGTAIGTVVLPLASELWAKQDLVRLRAGITLLYKYLFMIIIPVIAGVFTFSAYFLDFFFGPEYVVGARALQILLVGVLLFALAAINHSIFSAVGNPGIVTKIILLGALVNIILNVLLIPYFGIVGAALSTAASYTLAFILSVHKMRKLLQVEAPWGRWVFLLLLGALIVAGLQQLSLLMNLDHWLEMIISFAIACFLYIILLYLFKLIDFVEIQRSIRLLRWKE